jgi:hypothetical protein
MNREAVRQLHAAAVEDFAAAAQRIPAAAWLVPRAEGKWSPAEIVEHLNTTYAVVLDELAGGPGMKIRTKWWQRLLLYPTIRRRILTGRGFPPGARAPREVRPATVPADQRGAIAAFRELARKFDEAIADAVSGGRRVRITHAYFGRSSAMTGMLFAARHIEHHRAQLPR